MLHNIFSIATLLAMEKGAGTQYQRVPSQKALHVLTRI